MLGKNVLGQNPNKKIFRKNFLTFCMFFKFKRSILRGFFRFYFLFFFKQRYKIGDTFAILYLQNDDLVYVQSMILIQSLK